MPEQFTGLVEIQTGGGATTITLDGDHAEVTAGDNGQHGLVSVRDDTGAERVRIDTRGITVFDESGTAAIHLIGNSHRILIRNSSGEETGRIDGGTGNLSLGGNNSDGDVLLRNNDGDTRIHFSAGGGAAVSTSRAHINGGTGNLSLGGNDSDGDVLLRGNAGNTRIHLSAGGGAAVSSSRAHINGGTGNLSLGGNNSDGDVLLRSNDGDTRIHFSAGGGGAVSTSRAHINGSTGNLTLGGNNSDGDVLLRNNDGDTTIHLSAGGGPAVSTSRVFIDGAAGDIILQNADCAEEFEVDGAENIDPGSVLVISSENELKRSAQPYDRRVAGVVSGAGDYQPGILLDRQNSSGTRLPVALMGKVFCKVDARSNPIHVGDLLTTADLPGHAMKASDPIKAMGSIIGKALRPLQSGVGLIPVLVTLQ
jgi:hypothetical protein